MTRHVLGCMCQPTLSPCARCVRAGCWCLDDYPVDLGTANRDALIRHISDLESVIRKRNETIQRLQDELAGLQKWHDKFERRIADDPTSWVALMDGVDRVRALHEKVLWGDDHPTCGECVIPYPCRTIRALDGEQE